MKLERLLISAFLVPGLFCLAQDKVPADKPAQTEASAPVKPAPAAAPAPAAPAVAPGTEADSYIIGPTDTITISVWKENQFSGSLLVRPDGMISMPLLGDVQASGLTPLQLAAQIQEKLKKFVQDPQVSVVLSTIHSKVIYMLGEIGKKGPTEMTPNMTLLQAIASAGGLSDYANPKKLYLLRDEDGKHLKIPLNYKAALKGDNTFNILLKPGDTIVAP